MFDVQQLADFAIQKIKDFSFEHPDEDFYAFAIDANLLCLNSVQCFQQKLKEYQDSWPDFYSTDKQILKLKFNPGDWKYSDFANFKELECYDDFGNIIKAPFDQDAYDHHYYLDAIDQPYSEYAIAMNKILDILKDKNAFDCLRTTSDFVIMRVEHNY